MMKLCIISHTEHYKTKDGSIVGWGPTISEINCLLEIFDEIYHVAMLLDKTPPPSALPYCSNKIKFVELPALGGKSLLAKFKIIWNAPQVIFTVSETLKKADFFQMRTPTGIGVYLIPYLNFFVKKKGWYKYAGNWNQQNPPMGYRIQRSMLKHQSRKVTINGRWNNQPKHCITFENPCLTQSNLSESKVVIASKNYSQKLTFCFVGRLEKEKGVGRILKAFIKLNVEQKKKINKVHFVGEGQELEYYKLLAKKSGITMLFHGALPRVKVFEIYKQSHLFLLPSKASEGFPKVIAEAMCFGAIPVVSNISSIGQYIKNMENGFLLNNVSVEMLTKELIDIIRLPNQVFLELVSNSSDIINKFSFKYYNNRIKEIIIDFE